MWDLREARRDGGKTPDSGFGSSERWDHQPFFWFCLYINYINYSRKTMGKYRVRKKGKSKESYFHGHSLFAFWLVDVG